jgi:hypothetical protein
VSFQPKTFASLFRYFYFKNINPVNCFLDIRQKGNIESKKKMFKENHNLNCIVPHNIFAISSILFQAMKNVLAILKSIVIFLYHSPI